MVTRKPLDECSTIGRLFEELIRAPLIPFPLANAPLDAPVERGVYVIYDPKGVPQHVGATPKARNGIRQGLENHLWGLSAFTRACFAHDGSKLRNGYQFRYLIVTEPRERALLECYAIGHLCPSHVGQRTNSSARRQSA
jgi:hypothetical protein